MEISDRLTPAEIEQLRRDRKEIHEFCQELFSEPKPDQTQKPYHLTPSEIDSLRREMKASSDCLFLKLFILPLILPGEKFLFI